VLEIKLKERKITVERESKSLKPSLTKRRWNSRGKNIDSSIHEFDG
jgi:hypothetical protein